MTETKRKRIRWDDQAPRNGDVYIVAHIGYAGTIQEPAFMIYTPDEMHASWLLSARLVPGSQFFYADTPEDLKAEAERWLERFVSSLGAVFPPESPPTKRASRTAGDFYRSVIEPATSAPRAPEKEQ